MGIILFGLPSVGYSKINVDELIRNLKAKDVAIRKKAVLECKKIKVKNYRLLEVLITALKDENWEVRSISASILGKTKNLKAVEPLINALKDEDSDVRRTAAESLGKLGDGRAINPLIAIGDDYNYKVSKAAAKALGSIGKPALEPLIGALRKDGYQNRDRREFSALALGEIGDTRAIKPLFAALEDSVSSVSREAATALGKIGKPAVEPLIEVFLKDGSEYAAEALGKIGDHLIL